MQWRWPFYGRQGEQFHDLTALHPMWDKVPTWEKAVIQQQAERLRRLEGERTAMRRGYERRIARLVALTNERWRPIHVAPRRHGKWLLLATAPSFSHGGRHVVQARWSDPKPNDPGCWDVPQHDAWFLDKDFTHYMQLPPLPEIDQSDIHGE